VCLISRCFHSFCGANLANSEGEDEPEFLPVDARLLLDVQPPGPAAPIHATGRVVWVPEVPFTGQWRIGVPFDELTKSSRSQLHRTIVRQQARR